MSEYQFLAFRAVDRPLTDRELAYAQKQSSRAEITQWHFENEYHFGDFSGDAEGLLRRGYDVHLHYANFGVRKIAIRIPGGWPFPESIWSEYFGLEALSWKKDAKGVAGLLSVDPFHEPGDVDEIWAPAEYVNVVVEVRNRLLSGDARMLYLLWLGGANSQDVPYDVVEPPAPGGLAECLDLCGPLLHFFGLDPLILVAASEGAPAAPPQADAQHRFAAWVGDLNPRQTKQLLRRVLVEDAAAVKAEMLASVRESGQSAPWPAAALGRTLEDLLDRTEVLRTECDAKEEKKRNAAKRRDAEKLARQRKDRRQLMVKAPKKWLREAEKLVEARGTRNYRAAAEILADLREALADEGGDIASKHAAHLVRKHPTLNHLKSSLRKQGLLG